MAVAMHTPHAHSRWYCCHSVAKCARMLGMVYKWGANSSSIGVLASVGVVVVVVVVGGGSSAETVAVLMMMSHLLCYFLNHIKSAKHF